MKKGLNDCIVVGFALFAMFFGAGNLIFPPILGFMSGNQWLITFAAFSLTGICLPIAGIFAMGKSGGDIQHFAGKVHPLFADVFGTVIMLGIGPLLALPRTAATTYEIGVRPFSTSFSPVVSSTIFFTVVLLFSIKPSKVIDTVGKYLTPLLVVVLAAIVIRAAITPLGKLECPEPENFFLKGFVEGYQTMDALAAMLFATIIINAIKERGYSDKKSLLRVTLFSGFIAAIGLVFVYGGLLHAGATVSNLFPKSISRTELLITLCARLWGSTGQIILSLSIVFACITTAIGLTATAGQFFQKLFHGRVSYEAVVVVVSVFSCWLSNYGVENIIRYSVPLLEALYPVCILLTIMNLLDDYIPNRLYYVGGTVGTLLVSCSQALVSAEGIINDMLTLFGAKPITFEAAAVFLQKLPLANIGLSWLIPAFAGAVLCGLAAKRGQ